MTVAVQVNLTVRSAAVDFTAQSISVTFTLSKFGAPQTATLEMPTDFTAAQLNNIQNQMEMLFQKWVNRQ